MLAFMCYCYEVFTYPKFMSRDLEKVLEALSAQDKKITELSNRILQSTDLTIKAFDGQQMLNKSQSDVNHTLKNGLQDLFNMLQVLAKNLKGGNN